MFPGTMLLGVGPSLLGASVSGTRGVRPALGASNVDRDVGSTSRALRPSNFYRSVGTTGQGMADNLSIAEVPRSGVISTSCISRARRFTRAANFNRSVCTGGPISLHVERLGYRCQIVPPT